MDLTLKLLTAILMYFVLAPILGLLCHRLQWLEKAVVAFMILVLLPMHPAKSGFYLFPLPYLRTWLNGYEILFIYPLCLAIIISGALRHRSRLLDSVSLPLLISLIALFISNLVSATFSVAPFLSFQQVFRLGQMFLFVLGLSAFLRTDKEIKFLVHCLVALLLYLDIQFIDLRWIHKRYVFQEVLHKNMTGLFCYTLALIALTPRGRSENDPIKNYFAIIGLIGLMAAAQTQSRAATLFALATLVTSIIRRFRLKQSIKIVIYQVLFLCLVVPIVALSIKTGGNRFFSERTKALNSASDATRARMIQDSLSVASRHWVFGAGPNTFGPYISGLELKSKTLLEESLEGGSDSHSIQQAGITENFYYLFLAENGAFGLLAIVIFLLSPLIVALKSIFQFPRHHLAPLQLSLSLVLVFFPLHLKNERLFMFVPGLCLYLLMALLACAGARVMRKDSILQP